MEKEIVILNYELGFEQLEANWSQQNRESD